ncbi:MAG: hypothetical protein GX053_05285 [Tissierella sp.]|nr:hypothetical protein [Tissierella sp.]
MGSHMVLVGVLGIIVLVILLLTNKIRRSSRSTPLRWTLLCVALFIIVFFISSCSSDESINIDSDVLEITLEKVTGSNDFLKDNVILLKEVPIDFESYNLSIVGARYDISSGDATEDTFVGDGLVNETFEDSVGRGFQIGFENSKAEVKNRDGYLSLYLKFGFEDEDMSQRDSIIPRFNIEVRDDKDDDCVLVYNSQKDKYINLNSPYAVLIFKTFSDAEQFKITIDNFIFILDKIELD